MYENQAEGEYCSGKSKVKVFQRREVEVAHFNTPGLLTIERCELLLRGKRM